MSDQPTIFQAISAIIGEMGGIGKNQRNKDQGYNFRGIDDVLKELHPLFAKHGVFFAPTVLEREYEERISKSGTVGHVTHLHVHYKVYGPSGDFVEISTWGEGLDYSDKATNKAMTAAFKYAMFELFAIADPDDDADHNTDDGGSRDQTSNTHEVTNNEGKTYSEPDDPRIGAILRAAELGDNSFVKDIAAKFKQWGKLTDKQIDSASKQAFKILGEQTTSRPAPTTERAPFNPQFDEEPF